VYSGLPLLPLLFLFLLLKNEGVNVKQVEINHSVFVDVELSRTEHRLSGTSSSTAFKIVASESELF